MCCVIFYCLRALYEKKLKEIADSKNSAEQVLESFKAKLQERDDIIAQLKSANISDNSSKRDLPAKNEEENLVSNYFILQTSLFKMLKQR